MIIQLKKNYRVRIDYADGARLYVYGLKPDLTSWMFSHRKDAITMRTATVAAQVAHEVNKAVHCQPITATHAVATVEPFITRN